MVRESAINNLDIPKNCCQKIVIDKMIDLWLNQPKESEELFKEIAEKIANYETNNYI